jgi:anaerobic selenocysteine-containing dehydrogenase
MTGADDRRFEPNESVCPFCGVGCGIAYDPASGAARGWNGPLNTKGKVCPKGVAAWDVVDHPVIFRSYLLPAIREGTTLIVVDPRETPTAAAADHHLPVRPGHDIPLLNAMAATIVAEDRLDDEFCAERVDGLEEFVAVR